MATRRLALVVPPSTEVTEIRVTDIDDFGNPGGVWHDVTKRPEVKPGWSFADETFTAPPVIARAPEEPPPSIEDLQQQLAALAAQLAELAKAK